MQPRRVQPASRGEIDGGDGSWDGRMGREEGGDWLGVTCAVIGLSQKGRGSKLTHYITLHYIHQLLARQGVYLYLIARF